MGSKLCPKDDFCKKIPLQFTCVLIYSLGTIIVMYAFMLQVYMFSPLQYCERKNI